MCVCALQSRHTQASCSTRPTTMRFGHTLLCAVLLCLIPPFQTAEILVLTPFGSKSIRALFSTLANALVSNGYKVTIVTSGDLALGHQNITHLQAPHSSLDQMDLFEIRRDSSAFRLWLKALPSVAKEFYQDPKIMSLWNKRHEFDAVIINSAANEMAFPFLIDAKCPFITLAPVGTEPLQLAYLGNVVSPAALPSVVVPYDNSLSFWERTINTLATLILRAYYWRAVGKPLTAALRDMFPELQDPIKIYESQALSLLNRHFLLDGAIPLLPNQVEIGCLTCRLPNQLPEEVQEWIEGAGEAGVIYFSLGSFLDTRNMPSAYRDVLLQGFSLLRQRVLFKYSGPKIDLPMNVRAYEWLPQQDVLGHRSTRLFITHCGKHSASESVYHGVPMLGLPITFDQPRTCARLSRRGEAIVLQWEDLTVEKVVEAVTTLLSDRRYRERVQAVSTRLKAQKETPMEKAIWWINYTIQHGDQYMKFSGKDLSLSQYLLLDVLAILLSALLVTAGLVFLVARLLFRRLWPSRLWPWSWAKRKLE